MSGYTVRPIGDRSPFTGKHRHSPFQAHLAQTEELLYREVNALNGRSLVVELDLLDGQIRLDGKPYANAKVTGPAVRVAFESKHGPLQYATDRFWTWQDNLRAVALGLEALRKIERYGIAAHGQQYTGWKALPAGSGTPGPAMSREAAQRLLRDLSRCDVSLPLRDQVRKAKFLTHPDRNGGNRVAWDQLHVALEVLGL